LDLDKRHCLDMDKRHCFNRLKTVGISCLVLGKNHRLNWLKTAGSSCLGRNIYFRAYSKTHCDNFLLGL
jgi:hypothetical protein